jgi:branched-chain amino acid transport system ATP-binding protein
MIEPDNTRYGPEEGILVIDGLTKKFGGLTAVDDLSLIVTEGEILGFIGPNGAGKTTTFNCVTGLHAPEQGDIYFNGENITNWSTPKIVRSGLSRTFQNPRPIDQFTVKKNILFGALDNTLLSYQRYSDEMHAKVEDVCFSVGFSSSDLTKLPEELSYGGLIRLELARALVQEPDLLLIDETFAGLTATEVAEFVSIFENLRDDEYTFLIIDHNMQGLLEVIDRAVVISFGKKIAEGTPVEITEDPKVRKAYLGSEET